MKFIQKALLQVEPGGKLGIIWVTCDVVPLIKKHNDDDMRKSVEMFRGIEFVRISSLSKEQQGQVWDSFDHDKIIKIIKDQALMNDCILYADFQKWEAARRPLERKESKPISPALG